MPKGENSHRIALFIDFENLVTRTGFSPEKFDVQPLLDHLLEKGKVVYRRAYCDWTRFSAAKQNLHDQGIELMEVPPSTRAGKNSADIRLVIDALELAYQREHIDSFAIASGDSDFCPLAYKLRENNREVIGLGVKEATSPLLVKACDEFIYLRANTKESTRGRSKQPAVVPDIAREAAAAILTRATGPTNPGAIKEAIVRKQPDFDERDHGFSSFTKLLQALEKENLLRREQGAKGQWYVLPPGALMATLKGKTLFITGASRGIGKAIALRAARDGANIAIAAKTTEEHAKLPGTIFSAAKEIEAAGGKALALQVDIRFEDQIAAAMAKTAATFGGLDILVNNASAIFLAGTADTPMKRFDLMHQVNVRGTYACSQAALPYLAKAQNPHILNLSPPPSLAPKWFAPHLAYTLAKMGMSFCVLGMAEELKPQGIAVNALWPVTMIATAAVQNLLGGEAAMSVSRTPEIVADAAHEVLLRPSKTTTGHFFTDEEVLGAAGVTNFDKYAFQPGATLARDIFLD